MNIKKTVMPAQAGIRLFKSFVPRQTPAFAGVTFLCASLMFTPTPSAAAPPKPGSVGYLYESCANMLAEGTRLEDVYRTYCAAFMEGFFAGASVSYGITLPPPAPKDACAADRALAYTHINGRMCAQFPDYTKKEVTPAFMLESASTIVARWAAFEQDRAPDFWDRKASLELGNLLQPGDFCESLSAPPPEEFTPPAINPALLKIAWKSYLKIQDNVTLERKYLQCKGDLARWETDPKFSFDVSWCGGEIDGYLAGLRATDKLQTTKPEFSASCQKPLDRLYRTLDVESSMCLHDDVKPIDIARIFITRYENGIEKDEGFANLKALGAIGYETVYRGFLCAPPPKSNAPLSPMP